MYIPTHFRNKNANILISFINEFPFGMLISNGESTPEVTHLPFLLDNNQEELCLIGHFAAVNPQAQRLKDGDSVYTVFNGPHGYISPTLYTHHQNVPTWNYSTVHITGIYHRLEKHEDRYAVLQRTVAHFEPEWQPNWQQLDPKYVHGMLNAIVAFSITIKDFHSKFKLSQIPIIIGKNKGRTRTHYQPSQTIKA